MNFGIVVRNAKNETMIVLTDTAKNVATVAEATEETQIGHVFKLGPDTYHLAPFAGKARIGTLAQVQEYVAAL